MAGVVAALEGLVDPAGLEDVALGSAVVDLVRVRSLLDAVTAGFVGRWDARGGWADDGSRSAGARLGRDGGCSPVGAGAVVGRARRCRSMPLVARAWSAGEVSTDHVARLTRACTPERAERFGELEGELVAAAAGLDWVGFERVVALFETAADDEAVDPTDPDAVAAHERRELAKRQGRGRSLGDRWELSASMDRVGGVVFSTEWERITQELFEADWALVRAQLGDDAAPSAVRAALAGLRTPGQRRCDALVEMAIRAGATPEGGQRPRPSISVVVSLGELVGPIRETFNGLVLSRVEVARLLTEADVERIVLDPVGQPVTLTSPQRFFTGVVRRAVEVRDRVCQHPTCEVEAEFCQVDHVVEVAAGGQTVITNARLLCRTHNRQRPGRNRTGQTGTGTGKRGSSRSSGEADDPDQPAA